MGKKRLNMAVASWRPAAGHHCIYMYRADPQTGEAFIKKIT